jgi:hypothetical protein
VYLKNCVNSFSEIVNGLPHSKENLNQKSYISSGTLTLISFCGVESGCQSVILYGISCIWWHFNSFFRHFDPSVVAYNIYRYNYTTNELLLIKKWMKPGGRWWMKITWKKFSGTCPFI